MKKNIADDFKSSNSKIVLIRTNKQSGDIAGTKSKKFYKFLLRELRKEFNIKKEGFEYIEEENLSKGYLLLKKKFSTEIKGPPVIYEKNVREFKLKHKNYFIKDGYIYSVLEHKLSFNNWLEIFKKNNRKTIKQMGVIEVK
jgi:hypothetical protein